MLAQIVVGAQAIPTLNVADGVPGGGSQTELRVSQPIVFASAAPFGGRLQLHAMVDFEGITMAHGQLATGVFGEGFNDKRHPHTYAHELIASLVDPLRLPGLQWSLTVGKGFAPFGTDDPMNRPALGYPVNHHWSQILERAVVIAGVRRGAFTLEAGLFNGDEPEKPSQWPRWSRVGDSWSARALVRPAEWLELQGSFASVKSPEHRPGSGLTHDKVSLSARVEHRHGGDKVGYVLAEWAHDSEEGFFRYATALVEAQLSGPVHRGYFRLERTDRPEETRLTQDQFRSVRPHNENSNIGASRWNTVTGGYGFRPRGSWPVRFEAIVEGSYLHVARLGAGVFDPASVWGRNDLWMASVALRMQAGARAHRMGRYGVAAGDEHHTSHSTHGP